MIIVGISGLPGSGKSLVSDVARSMGIRVLVMGDVVRREGVRLGISPSEAAVLMRRNWGARYFAVSLLEGVGPVDKGFVIEGIRSMREVEAIEDAFGSRLFLIYVVASWRTRFERLRGRGREDDPRSVEDFMNRDYRELRFGLGDLASRADYFILNDGRSIEEVKDEARRILSSLFLSDTP